MSRIGFGLVAILAVVVGLLVGTFNSDKVVLDLLWVKMEWPLGLLILCAFALGLLVGLALLYLAQVLPLRLRLRRLMAEAARKEIPGTDSHDA
jgi:uncharacterized integral membrane protein